MHITFADKISNLTQLFSSTVNKPSQNCELIGISIDLDVVAPKDAPGVETPVDGGIRAEELIKALSAIRNKQKICTLEISEFNPETDVYKTQHLIKALVDAFYTAKAFILLNHINFWGHPA